MVSFCLIAFRSVWFRSVWFRSVWFHSVLFRSVWLRFVSFGFVLCRKLRLAAAVYLNETSTEEHTVPYNRLGRRNWRTQWTIELDDLLTGTMLQCQCIPSSGAQRLRLTLRL